MRYTGALDVLQRVAREHGISGWYKGEDIQQANILSYCRHVDADHKGRFESGNSVFQ